MLLVFAFTLALRSHATHYPLIFAFPLATRSDDATLLIFTLTLAIRSDATPLIFAFPLAPEVILCYWFLLLLGQQKWCYATDLCFYACHHKWCYSIDFFGTCHQKWFYSIDLCGAKLQKLVKGTFEVCLCCVLMFRNPIVGDKPRMASAILLFGEIVCNFPLSIFLLRFLLKRLEKVRANTSICPRLSAAIFVCAENVVKMRFFFASWPTSCCISARTA